MQRYNNTVVNPTGLAIAGASILVTVAATPPGTGAPASVFGDDGITPVSNTVVADNLGRFAFFVPDGKYDLTISGGTPTITVPYTLAAVEIVDLLEFNTLDQQPVTVQTLNLTQVASGATPGVGTINLYSKTADRLLYYKDALGVETGPLLPISGGPAFSTLAIKPQSNDNVQYVSPNGNDTNDGFSIGTAKLTVYAALQALPGGSSTSAGTGTVFISSAVNYGGPVANQGMWLMGPVDPNFASPPSGWLKFNGVGSFGLTIDCLGKLGGGPHGHDTNCIMNGGGSSDNVHPAVWISGTSGQISLKNLAFSNFRNTYVKYGIDSNNNRNGTGGASGFSMYNVSWNHGGLPIGAGPGMDIGSQSFWIWLKGLTVSGASSQVFSIVASTGATRASGVVTINTTSPHNILVGDTVTITNVLDDSYNSSFVVATVPDNLHFTFSQVGPNSSSGSGQVVTAGAAAINIDSGATGTGSGLIFIDDINLNNGNIRFKPGTSGGGFYARNISYEGSGVPDPPTVLVTSVLTTGTGGGQIVRIDNVEVSDSFNAVSAVEVDNAGPFPDATIVSRVAGPVRGQMTVLGGVAPTGSKGGAGATPGVGSSLSKGQFGLQEGQITATGIDVARRGFSPVAVPSANVATISPSSWTFNTGSGTITTGIAAPDGTSNAGRVTGTGQAFVQFYGNTTNLNLGDTYVFGVWARAVNGVFSTNPPIKFTFNSLGLGTGDVCQGYPGSPPGNGLILGNRRGGFVSDGQWQWYSGICTVVANPTTPGTTFNGIVDSTHAADFYAPVMMLLPAGTKSNNEAWEIANNLSSFSGNAGEVAMLPSQLFRPGSTTFANLGTPANGVFIYCSDCTIANPCAGGGTGALAKRLNSIWVCN